MINIISTQSISAHYGGPKKVFMNLVGGLKKIGYPYVINRTMNATKRLWIHDNVPAIRFMHRSSAYKIIGPNLVVLPSELPQDVRFGNTIYLHPSEWPIRQWQKAGFTSCPLRAWPVGVDTDGFQPASFSQGKKALVYHKMRDKRELPLIFDALTGLGIDSRFLEYGKYTEEEYPHILAETSFIIWHGCHESQGLALQEALSCNIPILVCDATSLEQYVGPYCFTDEYLNVQVSSAPYFDERCGVRIKNLEEFKRALTEFLDKLDTFQPRNFILENLTLEKQATEFVNLWRHWGLTIEEGYLETLSGNKSLQLPLKYRSGVFMKKALSRLMDRS